MSSGMLRISTNRLFMIIFGLHNHLITNDLYACCMTCYNRSPEMFFYDTGVMVFHKARAFITWMLPCVMKLAMTYVWWLSDSVTWHCYMTGQRGSSSRTRYWCGDVRRCPFYLTFVCRAGETSHPAAFLPQQDILVAEAHRHRHPPPHHHQPARHLRSQYPRHLWGHRSVRMLKLRHSYMVF